MYFISCLQARSLRRKCSWRVWTEKQASGCQTKIVALLHIRVNTCSSTHYCCDASWMIVTLQCDYHSIQCDYHSHIAMWLSFNLITIVISLTKAQIACQKMTWKQAMTQGVKLIHLYTYDSLIPKLPIHMLASWGSDQTLNPRECRVRSDHMNLACHNTRLCSDTSLKWHTNTNDDLSNSIALLLNYQSGVSSFLRSLCLFLLRELTTVWRGDIIAACLRSFKTVMSDSLTYFDMFLLEMWNLVT